MIRICVLWFLLAVGAATASAAQDVAVPDELVGWEDWVMHGEEYRRCPFLLNRKPGDERAHVCAWPGELEISATRTGARFSHSWQVLEEGWVHLPGNAKYWPGEVTVNGTRASVGNESNQPVLWLEPGSYRIAGRIRWTTRPTRLAIPPEAGLLKLDVDGNNVPFPRFDNSAVWLGEPPERETRETDSLRLQVYRLVSDELPVRFLTHVRLEVAGKNREIDLGRALPTGFIPMTLRSALPARLTVAGDLTVQVTAGSHEIEFLARANSATDDIAFQAGGADWPDTEVWSFRQVERLRISEPTGGEPIDPAISGTPWRDYPAFVMTAGKALSIEEKSRGMTGEERNELTLNRQLWLDFDGKGMTSRDSIYGQMRSGWRLDMAGPYGLLEASQGGEPLLVTKAPGEGTAGIEIRSTQLAIGATSRIDKRGGALPVTGWAEQFSNVSTNLNVPPGYRLLAAPGADNAVGAWIERWRLLDIFLALLVAVAVSRILNAPAGIAALVMMVLTYHEPGALRFSWVSLVVAIGLVRVAPEGRLNRIAVGLRNLSFVAVVVLALPFAAYQLRMTLFPQLELQQASWIGAIGPAAQQAEPWVRGDADVARRSQKMEMDRTESAAPGMADMATLEEAIVTAAPSLPPKKLSRYAPDALVQSGAGRPGWGWQSYALSWRGPVVEDQSYRLIIAPRWLTAIWHVLGVGLLALIVSWLARSSFGGIRVLPKPPAGSGKVAAGFVALLAAGLLTVPLLPATAQADTPDPVLLEELKRRLIEPPECIPDCAEIITARLDASAEQLSIALEVHVQANVAFPVPGSRSGFRPQRISVNGTKLEYFYQQGGSIWLRLDEGVHLVGIEGRLPPLDAVPVAFPELPRFIEVSARDWDVEGIVDNQLQRGAVTLRRRAAAEASPATALRPDQFPLFVGVNREITLDLDWTVQTHIERIAPQNGPINVRVPLLAGEQVLTEGLEAENGFLRIALGSGQQRYTFNSSLPRNDSFTLTAPDFDTHAETWRLNVSPIWRATHDGIPAVLPVTQASTNYVPEFRPLPGESLAVTVARPEAVPGPTLAIDNVREVIDVGKRARSVNMKLTVRSTRGGTHDIVLPAGAELEKVMIDGNDVLLRLVGNTLALPLEPAEHQVEIIWRETQAIGVRTVAPTIDLGTEASNVHVQMNLPGDRWTLLTFGPRLGPAVLLWAELIIFALAAVWLGRSGLTPLKGFDWLLLGFGLSTISWQMLFVFGFWIVALAFWQRRVPTLSRRWFNAFFAVLGAASVLVLLALLYTVPEGLLGRPDMHIIGNGSSSNVLRWFTDRADGILARPSAITVPLWAYKALLLAWALWLSFALIRWLKWAWTGWTAHGYWRGRIAPPSHGN